MAGVAGVEVASEGVCDVTGQPAEGECGEDFDPVCGIDGKYDTAEDNDCDEQLAEYEYDGDSAGGNLVAMLALGWKFNNIAVPVAFMVACTPTRVVTAKLIVGLLGALALAWAAADLAIVAVFSEVGRVPEALVDAISDSAIVEQ